MKKKKPLIFAIIMVMFILLLSACGGSRVDNDDAIADEKNRYLTIVNDTEEIINEVHIYVNSGTEIEAAEQNNPNEKSFSIKIPSQYEDYDTFVVELIDRYELKYSKEVSNVPAKGTTEVVITKDNYVKQKGDMKKKVDRWFNN